MPSAGGTQKEQQEQAKAKDQAKDKQSADDTKSVTENAKDQKPSDSSSTGTKK